MSRRRILPRHSIATTFKAAELAWAAPQVVAHRVGRMSRSGPFPSQRDRDEFHRMWSEKAVAFSTSWFAMTTEAMTAQQAWPWSLAGRFWNPWSGAPAVGASKMHDAAWRVFAAGLRPIHRTAVANARRLSAGG